VVERPLRILQVSTSDIAGGAERVAWNLFRRYWDLGHRSWLAVGHKKSGDSDVIRIPNARVRPIYTRALLKVSKRLSRLNQRSRVSRLLGQLMHWMAEPHRSWDIRRGIEDFHYPGSRGLLDLLPVRPDIVHAHNLHGGYFDLRSLADLSRRVPVVLTLHDEWMLTGHCAYTLGCSRWEHGCGDCPDLTIYPAIQRDATALNWRRKRAIYERSRLYVVAPSQWLLDRVRRSMLAPVECRVIHNGIDLAVFRPADRRRVRSGLDLPPNGTVLLAVAHSWSRFKNYAMLERAVTLLGNRPELDDKQAVFVVLGGHEATETRIGNVLIRQVPFLSDVSEVAQYYQAADVFLHAAHSENFPNVTLEALACGVPVVATAVGGIPEQIEAGVTGFLVPPGGGDAMSDRVAQLLADDRLRQQISVQAVESARRRFTLDRQVDAYLAWYQRILDSSASPF
jgi:glycosyltransferase involved in cell wall biosynthesis